MRCLCQRNELHDKSIRKVERGKEVSVFICLSLWGEYPGYVLDDLNVTLESLCCWKHNQEAEKGDNGSKDELRVDPGFGVRSAEIPY